jgi:methylglyoxal synthase
LKTIIFVEHDQDTDEFECRFARRFNDMTREQQLAATTAAIERLESLSLGLKAIIAGQTAGDS